MSPNLLPLGRSMAYGSVPSGKDLVTLATALVSVALIALAAGLLLLPHTADETVIAGGIVGAIGGYWLHASISNGNETTK